MDHGRGPGHGRPVAVEVDVPGLVPTHGRRRLPVVRALADPACPTTAPGWPWPSRTVWSSSISRPDGHRDYDVPGLDKSALWRDDAHVLLSVEERPTMREVDLGTGAVAKTDVDPSTRFLEGGWVSWPRHGGIATSAGPVETADVGNDGGIDATVPLADSRVVVGLGGDGMRNGAVVVDRGDRRRPRL